MVQVFVRQPAHPPAQPGLSQGRGRAGRPVRELSPLHALPLQPTEVGRCVVFSCGPKLEWIISWRWCSWGAWRCGRGDWGSSPRKSRARGEEMAYQQRERYESYSGFRLQGHVDYKMIWSCAEQTEMVSGGRGPRFRDASSLRNWLLLRAAHESIPRVHSKYLLHARRRPSSHRRRASFGDEPPVVLIVPLDICWQSRWMYVSPSSFRASFWLNAPATPPRRTCYFLPLCSIYPQQQRHHGVRFHNMQGQGLGGADGEGAGEAAKVAPELSLSTLEYYLFTFAWVRRGQGQGHARAGGRGRGGTLRERERERERELTGVSCWSADSELAVVMMGVFSAFAKPFLDCCLGEGQKLSWVSLRKESPHLAGFCVQQNAANTDNLHGSKAPFARGLIVAVFAPLCRVVADGSTRCHRAKTSTSGTRGRAGCLPFSTGDATKSTSGRSGWRWVGACEFLSLSLSLSLSFVLSCLVPTYDTVYVHVGSSDKGKRVCVSERRIPSRSIASECLHKYWMRTSQPRLSPLQLTPSLVGRPKWLLVFVAFCDMLPFGFGSPRPRRVSLFLPTKPNRPEPNRTELTWTELNWSEPNRTEPNRTNRHGVKREGADPQEPLHDAAPGLHGGVLPTQRPKVHLIYSVVGFALKCLDCITELSRFPTLDTGRRKQTRVGHDEARRSSCSLYAWN